MHACAGVSVCLIVKSYAFFSSPMDFNCFWLSGALSCLICFHSFWWVMGSGKG